MINKKHILLPLGLFAVVACVSAATTNMTGGMSATLSGPYRLVSLGIETVAPLYASTYYNWISVAILFVIGSLSSSRNTRFFAILIPALAAMFVWFEWLQSSDPVQTWGIIVLCAILGVFYYMKDSLRERFGTGGSGSMVINIAIYLIVLQAMIGMINTTALWGVNSQNTPISSYTNVQLSTQIPEATNTGGILQDVVSALSVLGIMAISALKLFLQILLSLAAFSVVLALAYPWMAATPLGIAVLGVIQIGIWLIYSLFLMNLFYKPPIGVSDF